jgi:hypothetical protein
VLQVLGGGHFGTSLRPLPGTGEQPVSSITLAADSRKAHFRSGLLRGGPTPARDASEFVGRTCHGMAERHLFGRAAQGLRRDAGGVEQMRTAVRQSGRTIGPGASACRAWVQWRFLVISR